MLHVESMICTNPNNYAVFIKEEPSFIYERVGNYLIGINEEQFLFDLLYDQGTSRIFHPVDRGAITLKNGEVIPPRQYFTLSLTQGVEFLYEQGVGPLKALPVRKLVQIGGVPEIVYEFLYMRTNKYSQLIEEYKGPIYSEDNFKIQLSKNNCFLDQLILLGHYSLEEEPNKIYRLGIEVGKQYTISMDAIKPGELQKSHMYMMDHIFTVTGDRGDGYYYLDFYQDSTIESRDPLPAIKGVYLNFYDPEWEDELPF